MLADDLRALAERLDGDVLPPVWLIRALLHSAADRAAALEATLVPAAARDTLPAGVIDLGRVRATRGGRRSVS